MSISGPTINRTPTSETAASATAGRADLLDAEGALTSELERALRSIFLKYATQNNTKPPAQWNTTGDSSLAGFSLSPEGLARFGIDTNGTPIPDDQVQEMQTYLDCNAAGELTYSGFLQMYQLQTENEPAETWSDLGAHGYNKNLELS